MVPEFAALPSPACLVGACGLIASAYARGWIFEAGDCARDGDELRVSGDWKRRNSTDSVVSHAGPDKRRSQFLRRRIVGAIADSVRRVWLLGDQGESAASRSLGCMLNTFRDELYGLLTLNNFHGSLASWFVVKQQLGSLRFFCT